MASKEKFKGQNKALFLMGGAFAWVLSYIILPNWVTPDPGFTTPLPQALSNNAVAQAEARGIPHLYSFSGLRSGKTHNDIASASYKLHLTTYKWIKIPDVPGGKNRLASIAVTVKNKIYIIGGYTVAEDGAEKSTPEVFMFDPEEVIYERKADMPTPVDDTVALTYKDRYIYLISGWHDTANVSLTQIYDTETNVWDIATPYPGSPVFGHAGGILGDKMLITDGVAYMGEIEGRRTFGIVDETYMGLINPDDPRSILWQALPPHSGDPLYRMAAKGTEVVGGVLFTGGSNNPYNYNAIGYNGEPSPPSNTVFAFNFTKGEWVDYAPRDFASMDHRGLLELEGTFFTIGGMEEGQQVSDKVFGFKPTPKQ